MYLPVYILCRSSEKQLQHTIKVSTKPYCATVYLNPVYIAAILNIHMIFRRTRNEQK